MPDDKVLSQLRDIHLPAPVGFWPPAPGWYFLAFFLILGITGILFYLFTIYRHGLAKRQALKLLAGYKRQHLREENSQATCARISELLRRVALVYYPRAEVASLQGEAWLGFLKTTGRKTDFNEVRQALLLCPYQPSGEYDLEPLFKLAETWIKQRRKPCLN